jgi:phenylacetate-CoA ligase
MLHLALGAEVGVATVEIPPNSCNVVCGIKETGPPSLLGYFWHALRNRKLFHPESIIELRGRVERQLVLHLTTLPPLDPLPPGQRLLALDRYLDQITALRPAHLRGFPAYLVWLADRCVDRGAAPPELRAVGPYGGLTSPVMMDRVARGLGCRFVQRYGTSELGLVAGACGRSPGMHLFEDLFHVEVLRRGQSVGPGEVGRLVITDLINAAMPLIRYDVGDVGMLHTGPCPCGRQTARLEVLGRVQEVLDAPAGLRTPSEVADTVFTDPHADNFRLEEVAPGSFEMAFVARASGGAPDVEGWRDRFAALHGGIRRVRARVVPFVQPEASGKYRFVFPRANGSTIL